MKRNDNDTFAEKRDAQSLMSAAIDNIFIIRSNGESELLLMSDDEREKMMKTRSQKLGNTTVS